jgi:hypothetical protein
LQDFVLPINDIVSFGEPLWADYSICIPASVELPPVLPQVGDSLDIPNSIALNISAQERRRYRRSLVSRQDCTHVDCRPGAYTEVSKKLNSGGVASSPTAFGDARMAKVRPLFFLSAPSSAANSHLCRSLSTSAFIFDQSPVATELTEPQLREKRRTRRRALKNVLRRSGKNFALHALKQGIWVPFRTQTE